MPNKMEGFTAQARQILSLAQVAAEELNAPNRNAIHLLVGMTRAEKSEAFEILIEKDIIEAKLFPFVKSQQEKPVQRDNSLDLSDGLKRILEISVDVARRFGMHYINSAHLLIGLMRLVNESKRVNENIQQEIAQLSAILEHFDVSAVAIIEHTQAQCFNDFITAGDLFGCRDRLFFLFVGTGKRKNDE